MPNPDLLEILDGFANALRGHALLTQELARTKRYAGALKRERDEANTALDGVAWCLHPTNRAEFLAGLDHVAWSTRRVGQTFRRIAAGVNTTQAQPTISPGDTSHDHRPTAR